MTPEGKGQAQDQQREAENAGRFSVEPLREALRLSHLPRVAAAVEQVRIAATLGGCELGEVTGDLALHTLAEALQGCDLGQLRFALTQDVPGEEVLAALTPNDPRRLGWIRRLRAAGALRSLDPNRIKSVLRERKVSCRALREALRQPQGMATAIVHLLLVGGRRPRPVSEEVLDKTCRRFCEKLSCESTLGDVCALLTGAKGIPPDWPQNWSAFEKEIRLVAEELTRLDRSQGIWLKNELHARYNQAWREVEQITPRIVAVVRARLWGLSPNVRDEVIESVQASFQRTLLSHAQKGDWPLESEMDLALWCLRLADNKRRKRLKQLRRWRSLPTEDFADPGTTQDHVTLQGQVADLLDKLGRLARNTSDQTKGTVGVDEIDLLILRAVLVEHLTKTEAIVEFLKKAGQERGLRAVELRRRRLPERVRGALARIARQDGDQE